MLLLMKVFACSENHFLVIYRKDTFLMEPKDEFFTMEVFENRVFHISGTFIAKKNQWNVTGMIEWTDLEKRRLNIINFRHQHLINIGLILESSNDVFLDIFNNNARHYPTQEMNGLGRRALQHLLNFLVKTDMISPSADIYLDAVGFQCPQGHTHNDSKSLETYLGEMTELIHHYEPHLNHSELLSALHEALIIRYDSFDLKDLEFVKEVYCALKNQLKLVQYYQNIGFEPVNGILDPLGETRMHSKINEVLANRPILINEDSNGEATKFSFFGCVIPLFSFQSIF